MQLPGITTNATPSRHSVELHIRTGLPTCLCAVVCGPSCAGTGSLCLRGYGRRPWSRTPENHGPLSGATGAMASNTGSGTGSTPLCRGTPKSAAGTPVSASGQQESAIAETVDARETRLLCRLGHQQERIAPWLSPQSEETLALYLPLSAEDSLHGFYVAQGIVYRVMIVLGDPEALPVLGITDIACQARVEVADPAG